MPVIKGKAYWASVQQPNKTFEPCWTVQVVVSGEEAKKYKEVLEELRETPKDSLQKIEKDEEKGGYAIRIEQRVHRQDGSENSPPRVVNADGEPFTQLIGNGSDVHILYRPARTTYKGRAFLKGFLHGVKVINLIPYVGRNADEEEFYGKSASSSKNESSDGFDEDFD
jgi:hypothetical protein